MMTHQTLRHTVEALKDTVRREEEAMRYHRGGGASMGEEDDDTPSPLPRQSVADRARFQMLSSEEQLVLGPTSIIGASSGTVGDPGTRYYSPPPRTSGDARERSPLIAASDAYGPAAARFRGDYSKYARRRASGAAPPITGASSRSNVQSPYRGVLPRWHSPDPPHGYTSIGHRSGQDRPASSAQITRPSPSSVEQYEHYRLWKPEDIPSNRAHPGSFSARDYTRSAREQFLAEENRPSMLPWSARRASPDDRRWESPLRLQDALTKSNEL